MNKTFDGIDEVKKLLEKRDELNDKIMTLTEEGFKYLIKDFVAQVKLLNIPSERVLDEVSKMLGMNASKSIQKGTSKVKPQGWDKGEIYVNPENTNDSWKGGKKGPKPAWLAEQFAPNMDLDAMKAVFARLKKSK